MTQPAMVETPHAMVRPEKSENSMQISFLNVCLIALPIVACSTTPPAATPEQDPCPAPTAACMNEQNHAECKSIAASCDGRVAQLESCPLQFSCEK